MITPTAIDWDGDGDFDLIVGDEDGRVALVENTGEVNDSRPVFQASGLFPAASRHAEVRCAGNAVRLRLGRRWRRGHPVRQHGRLHRSVREPGQSRRRTAQVDCSGTAEGRARRKPFRILAGPSGSIQGPCEAKWGYTTLSVADWDDDDDPDIIFNSIWSQIGVLRNDDGSLVEDRFATAASVNRLRSGTGGEQNRRRL